MKYYPIKCYPYLKSTLWGGKNLCRYKHLAECQEAIGESWELSAVEGHVSIVSNGPLKGKTLNDLIALDPEGLMGKQVYKACGTNFPLLVKFLDAEKDLSVQVHPDDAFAKKYYGKEASGKTEMAYVIDAAPEAKLIAGFSQRIDEHEYAKRIAENTIEEVLLKHHAHPGDVYFIPPGRVHAYGGGLLLVEVQQSSDITYRLYDYNRRGPDGKLRELHTELAQKALDYRLCDEYKTAYHIESNQVVNIVKSPYFTVNLMDVNRSEVERDLSQYETFSICVCLKGEAVLTCENGTTETIGQGETVLIPGAIAGRYVLSASEEASILETYIV